MRLTPTTRFHHALTRSARCPAKRAAVRALAAVALGAGLAACTGCGSSQGRELNAAESIQRDRTEALRVAQQASKAQSSGDMTKAVELYRRSIEHSPDIPAVWNNLGIAMMEQENYSGAVAAFQRAADLDPGDNRPVENIGLAYSKVGWSQEALTQYSRALDISPNSLVALRGSVQEAARLGIADHTTLARVKRAMLTETDPKWRTYFERQRFRIQGAMRDTDF